MYKRKSLTSNRKTDKEPDSGPDWKKLLGLSTSVVVGAGVFIVFIYCFFLAHFLPSGLKTGDTFFFSLILLSLGTTGTLLALIGFFVWVPLTIEGKAAFSERNPSGFARAVAMMSASLIGALLVRRWVEAIVYVEPDRESYLIELAILAAVLFALVLLADQKKFWPEDAFFRAPRCEIPKRIWRAAKQYRWPVRLQRPVAAVICAGWFALVVGVGSAGAGNVATTALLSVGLMGSGFCFLLALQLFDQKTTSKSAEKRRKRTMATFLVLTVVLPFLICGSQDRILESVMGRLGIFSSDAALVVDSANHDTLLATARANGIPLYECSNRNGKYIVSHLRIWWHGAGDKSYVEILSPRSDDSRGVRVELMSAGVFRSDSRGSCIEMTRDLYFDSGNPHQSKQQRLEAENALAQFVLRWNLTDTTVVTGYADPMTPKTGSNMDLSRARACEVASLLRHASLPDGRMFEQAASRILIEAQGDDDTVVQCTNGKDGADRRTCEERNRRVSVRFVRLTDSSALADWRDAADECPEFQTGVTR